MKRKKNRREENTREKLEERPEENPDLQFNKEASNPGDQTMRERGTG